METEGGFFGRGQGLPIAQRLVQHDEGADHVCLDEGARSVDGAIDVALGRQVGDDSGLEFAQRAGHRFNVADIGLNEAVAAAGGYRL
ncbi:hypothetical protein D3C72_1847450 [compost metagenome]